MCARRLILLLSKFLRVQKWRRYFAETQNSIIYIYKKGGGKSEKDERLSENQEESVEGFARHDDEKGVHEEREEDESGRKEEKRAKGARGDRKKVRTTGYCTKRIRYRARARACVSRRGFARGTVPRNSLSEKERGVREKEETEEEGREERREREVAAIRERLPNVPRLL